MNYYTLKSILGSSKRPFQLQFPSDSFYVNELLDNFIEPTFDKVIFEGKHPSIILISAIGATGKTTLAKKLSMDLNLPLLDLGKHKPVGDHSLSGLITNHFDIKDVSGIFESIGEGSYGFIIDGVDEGRSKTTELAFNAFLDDVARRCSNSKKTTFLLLGRTQILEDCWSYLSGHSLNVGLLSIEPFTVDRAKLYIDTNTGIDSTAAFYAQYQKARDCIIEALGRLFVQGNQKHGMDFLSFIGYAPVLDSIATMLKNDRNYQKVIQHFPAGVCHENEIDLLINVIEWILSREREQKVLPNILMPILEDSGYSDIDSMKQTGFSKEEQCIRILSYCLDMDHGVSFIDDPLIQARYEEHLNTWIPEHPFLAGKKIKNVIFEAYIIAIILNSAHYDELATLISEYMQTTKSNYHLIYILSKICPSKPIPSLFLGDLIACAMEYNSIYSRVCINIDGSTYDEMYGEEFIENDVDVDIDITFIDKYGKVQPDYEKRYTLKTELTSDDNIHIRTHVGNMYMAIPCALTISDIGEIHLSAPIQIQCYALNLNIRAIVAKSWPHSQDENYIRFYANSLESSVQSITPRDVQVSIILETKKSYPHPLVKYISFEEFTTFAPELREKYFRLRRIALEFASHSKGGLAKYKYKIEHMRVLKNDFGMNLLRKLKEDRILELCDNMYFLDSKIADEKLGISWMDLRKGKCSETLKQYLLKIT